MEIKGRQEQQRGVFKAFLNEYDRYARATRVVMGVGAAAHVGSFALAVGVGECPPVQTLHADRQ